MEAAALVLAAAVPTAAVVLVAGGAIVSMTFVEIQVKVAFTKVRVNVFSLPMNTPLATGTKHLVDGSPMENQGGGRGQHMVVVLGRSRRSQS